MPLSSVAILAYYFNNGNFKLSKLIQVFHVFANVNFVTLHKPYMQQKPSLHRSRNNYSVMTDLTTTQGQRLCKICCFRYSFIHSLVITSFLSHNTTLLIFRCRERANRKLTMDGENSNSQSGCTMLYATSHSGEKTSNFKLENWRHTSAIKIDLVDQILSPAAQNLFSAFGMHDICAS